MKGLMTGALVTVLSGSALLANERGAVRVEPGQAALLARAEAPLRVASPQDAEALLKRLEQLVTRVAKLEEEIGRLEARNKQLKEQVRTNPFGGAGWSGAQTSGGVRIINGAAPGQPGASVILEVEEKKEK